jgi:hypothetical protein
MNHPSQPAAAMMAILKTMARLIVSPVITGVIPVLEIHKTAQPVEERVVKEYLLVSVNPGTLNLT